MTKHLTFPILIVFAAGALAGAAVQIGRNDDDAVPKYAAPVLPTRTAAAAVVPVIPPLPPGADAVPALRFRVTTVWRSTSGASRRATQEVTRTAERIQLVLDGAKKEWLFERNPLDPRRIAGYLIDHGARRILSYDESELRVAHQLRGWVDALAMRVDRSVLETLRRKTGRRYAAGAAFSHYVSTDRSRDGVIEVWWNDELLLPLELRVRQQDVITESAIDRLEHLPAGTRLGDPRLQHPTYRIFDAADAHDHQR